MKFNRSYIGQSLAQNPEHGKSLVSITIMFINRLNYFEVFSLIKKLASNIKDNLDTVSSLCWKIQDI